MTTLLDDVVSVKPVLADLLAGAVLTELVSLEERGLGLTAIVANGEHRYYLTLQPDRREQLRDA